MLDEIVEISGISNIINISKTSKINDICDKCKQKVKLKDAWLDMDARQCSHIPFRCPNTKFLCNACLGQVTPENGYFSIYCSYGTGYFRDKCKDKKLASIAACARSPN